MRITNRRRNRRNKKIITKILILSFIAGILILSYKSYNYFHMKKVQANKVVVATKEVVASKEAVKDKVEQVTPKTDEKENTFSVSPDGEKYTYPVEKVRDMLENKGESDGIKIAFLTFDDGPSTTVTPQILQVLKNYNVKATFYLVGQNIEANERSKELVKETFEQGHALGNHTYTHNFKKLYPGNKVNVDIYMQEVLQTNNAIRNILGQGFDTRVLRMPGGYMSRTYYKDPNLEAFNAKLNEKQMYSIDWNAQNSDAQGKKKSAAELVEEAKKTVGTKEKVVILMHDTYGKDQTAKALPQIIQYLKDNGYEFKTMK